MSAVLEDGDSIYKRLSRPRRDGCHIRLSADVTTRRQGVKRRVSSRMISQLHVCRTPTRQNHLSHIR